MKSGKHVAGSALPLVLLIVFLLLGSLLFVITAKRKQPAVDIGNGQNQKNGTMSLSEASIPDTGITVSLAYDSHDAKPLKILKATRSSTYLPVYLPQDKGYRIELLDKDNAILYSKTFAIPNQVEDIQALLSPNPKGHLVNIDKINFSYIIPSSGKAVGVALVDPNGTYLQRVRLTGKQVSSNQPQLFPNLWRQVFPAVYAQSSKKSITITFTGSGYNKSANRSFQKDAFALAETISKTPPFSDYHRASQLFLRTTIALDAQVGRMPDLQCRHGSIIVCEDSLQTFAAETNLPTDIWIVVVNQPETGGYVSAGSGMLVLSNTDNMHALLLHELGHAIGDLWDEYPYEGADWAGVQDNQVHSNCYAGQPPAVAWKDAVPDNQYNIGCTYQNWYSPQTSVMRDFSVLGYNIIDQYILKERLQYFLNPPPALYREHKQVAESKLPAYDGDTIPVASTVASPNSSTQPNVPSPIPSPSGSVSIPSPSSYQPVACPAAVSLSGTANGSEVTLTWTPLYNVNKYVIRYSQQYPDGTWSDFADLPGAGMGNEGTPQINSFTHVSVEPNTTYSYVVNSICNDGSGTPASNTLTVHTP